MVCSTGCAEGLLVLHGPQTEDNRAKMYPTRALCLILFRLSFLSADPAIHSPFPSHLSISSPSQIRHRLLRRCTVSAHAGLPSPGRGMEAGTHGYAYTASFRGHVLYTFRACSVHHSPYAFPASISSLIVNGHPIRTRIARVMSARCGK
jgi:hypothetical protein